MATPNETALSEIAGEIAAERDTLAARVRVLEQENARLREAILKRCPMHGAPLLPPGSNYKRGTFPEHFNGSAQWACGLTAVERAALADPPRPPCGLCGKPAAGCAAADDVRLCHPDDPEAPDCYTLWTLYKQRPGRAPFERRGSPRLTFSVGADPFEGVYPPLPPCAHTVAVNGTCIDCKAHIPADEP